MVKQILPIIGYIHLYRSLLRFYDMPENEVKEMLYALNTANLDCFGYYHPDIAIIESGPATFAYRWRDRTTAPTVQRFSYTRRLKRYNTMSKRR